MRVAECEALLFAQYDKKAKRRQSEACAAAAAFTSRDKPCCWVHYQADTRGPRAGAVEWFRRKAAK